MAGADAHGVIPCPLARAAGTAPADPAVVTAAGAVSYGDLHRLAARMAAGLGARGIGAGHRVGILAAPSSAAVALFWALWRLGAVACPVSTRLPPGPAAEALASVNARLLVSDRGYDAPGPPSLALETLAAAPGTGTTPSPSLHLGRPATVLFTSGSTGQPRAVLHTAGNHHFSALGANANLPLAPRQRWLLSLPVYHAGGLAILWRAATAGAAVALAAPGPPLAETLRSLAPTHLSLVPTQLWRLLRHPDAVPAPGGLRGILVGGAATAPELLLEARDQGLPVVATYGSTEAASQVTATRPGEPAAALHTSGRPLAHRELRIDGHGEILIRGRTLARGYLRGGALEALVDEDGWFHTGDLGSLDADGRLRVTGRRDNLFISGGENIQPEEVERALNALPGIARSLVVGIPHPEFGHRPVAFVELHDGAPPDTGGLRTRLAEGGRLARFMLPDHVLPWPATEDPGTKPDRHRLAALAAAALAARGE